MLVLVVDDDPEDVEIFCYAMQSIDPTIKCIVANDGIDALGYLNQGTIPDFIFLDINMPKMNGHQCLTQIRADPGFNDITIVMHSTSSSLAQIQAFKSMDVLFLQKPTSIKKLIGSLSEILKINH